MSEANSVTRLIEESMANNAKAVEIQMNFYKDFTRRQGEALAGLTDSRLSSLKEIAHSGSLEKAIEQNLAFEKQAQEVLTTLHSTNISAFETLSTSLKDIYTPEA